MLMLIKFNYTSTYRGYPMEPVPGTEPGERVAEGRACGLTPKEKFLTGGVNGNGYDGGENACRVVRTD